jgi:hypothetical protein
LLREGLIFCTFKSLIAKSKEGSRRIDQIMHWLGDEGIEIFHQGHKAKHAFADENGKATQTGQAVLEIQDPVKFPEMRVVYSSATAASEVRHLAYQIRLGLWSEETSFPLGFAQFGARHQRDGDGLPRPQSDGQIFLRKLAYGH